MFFTEVFGAPATCHLGCPGSQLTSSQELPSLLARQQPAKQLHVQTLARANTCTLPAKQQPGNQNTLHVQTIARAE